MEEDDQSKPVGSPNLGTDETATATAADPGIWLKPEPPLSPLFLPHFVSIFIIDSSHLMLPLSPQFITVG